MFNIRENLYAVLTHAPEKQIIVWTNNVTPYPHILLHQQTNNIKFANQQNSESNNFDPLKVFTGDIPDDIQPQLHNVTKMIVSTTRAFAALLNDGSVLCWGNEDNGGKIPDETQKKLANVTKMIFSTHYAFAALLNDGSVVAWGNQYNGGKIPDDIQKKLVNVKIIIPNEEEFTAVCINGDTFTWSKFE